MEGHGYGGYSSIISQPLSWLPFGLLLLGVSACGVIDYTTKPNLRSFSPVSSSFHEKKEEPLDTGNKGNVSNRNDSIGNEAENQNTGNGGNQTGGQLPPSVTLPSPPQQFRASVLNQRKISLAWDIKNQAQVSNWKIYRAVRWEEFSEIASLDAGESSYEDTDVSENIKYWYKMKAYNAAGSSIDSDQFSITIPAEKSYGMVRPTDLRAIAVTNEGIHLFWVDTCVGDSRYLVWVIDQEGVGTYYDVPANSNYFFLNKGLISVNLYTVTVLAVKDHPGVEGGHRYWSNSVNLRAPQGFGGWQPPPGK